MRHTDGKEYRSVSDIVNTSWYPIEDTESCQFQECVEKLRQELKNSGRALLPSFLRAEVIDDIVRDVEQILSSEEVFKSDNYHNIYLNDDDNSQYDSAHPRRMPQHSAKACVTYDQVPNSCALSVLFRADSLTEFIRYVLGKEELYRTADPLGALNIHVYEQQHELGWHFDRGEFAVTLLIRKPEDGGEFQCIRDLRFHGDDVIGKILLPSSEEGEPLQPIISVPLEPGTLMIFNGHNSLHRVTPVLGATSRILSVLSYESKPDVYLNTYTRMKFYGR